MSWSDVWRRSCCKTPGSKTAHHNEQRLVFQAQLAVLAPDNPAMHKIALVYEDHGQPRVVREVNICDRPIAVGSDASADVVLFDGSKTSRTVLFQRRNGVLSFRELRGPGHVASAVRGAANWRTFTRDAFIKLGAYRLVAIETEGSAERDEPVTARAEIAEGVREFAVMYGPRAQRRRLQVRDEIRTIGLSTDNDIVVTDPTVSRFHCRLEPFDSGVVVRDLGSRNGTYLDGARVDRAVVTDHAELRIGTAMLRIMAVDQHHARSESPVANRVVAASAEMLDVLAQAARFAQLPWPVLITGESGVGKEGIAQELHRRSDRSRGAFHAINAGCIARELIESELFGHERGSFTGAERQRRGLFELSSGGTLFLDEIGELPLDLQTRLLRVLETNEVRRVGAESSFKVDVRIVCATHRNLSSLVESGEFREDLFYRLSRLVIEIPPLRNRTDDIGALATHFLAQMSMEVGHRELSEDAAATLLGHEWRGNARELRNALSRAAALTTDPVISAETMRLALGKQQPRVEQTAHMRKMVDRYNGNVAKTARALGVARTTLRDHLRRTP